MSNQQGETARGLYNWDDKQVDSAQGPFIILMKEHTVIFIWFIVALFLASIFTFYAIKTYLRQRWGIICCDCGRERARWIRSRDAAVATSQLRRNAAISAQQQKELDDEARRKALERTKRILGEFTLIVEADHLDIQQHDSDALEAGTYSAIILNMPGVRRTEGHCAICIAEYAPGDKVVWSPNDECCHVFHNKCILSWISKDRKDCPCCRMSFVPDGESEADEDKRESNACRETSLTRASLDIDESESSFGDEEETGPSGVSGSSNHDTEERQDE